MMNILLLEPDKVLAETYKSALELRSDSIVSVVRSAQHAITAADAITPDLVIVELQLIEHSGIEFLYEFRSYIEWQSIPIIVHSIVPFSEFTDNWNILNDELGVQKYLYKPHTTLRMLIQAVSPYSLISA